MTTEDEFTLEILDELLNAHILYVKSINNTNQKFKNKKIRSPNFPEAISENIVKFAYNYVYKISPLWNIASGDLELYDIELQKNIKLEVKGFSSNGPSSFGPTEQWNKIYFVDCCKFMDKQFIIYEICLSNKDYDFYMIKVNKKETYKDQCDAGKRPRITFNEIKKQLGNKCKEIFNGSIDLLNISLNKCK
jgi:hypothetical protein